MKIYNQEILDGLQQAIASKVVASYVCDAPIKKLTRALAKNANLNQPDLFYIDDCTLVSTAWNLNDDVFGSEELYKARKSPVDKQFNYMHDDSFIIGHITSAEVRDYSGNKIEEGEEIPKEFDISISSVLYTYYSDENRKKLVAELISEIPDGKWAVSMECLLKDFDYAVISPDGEQKVIARNEESSFLTKHLRIYGGSGEYQGYKIGRFLKDIVFSGVGLVDKPANVRSEIKSFSFNGAKASIRDFSEVLMSNETKTVASEKVDTVSKAQYDELKAELAKAKEIADQAAKKDLEEAKALNESLAKELASVKETLSNTEKLSAEQSAKIEELNKSVAAVTEKYNEAQKEIDSVKAAKKNQERINKLVTAGLNSDEANKVVATFATASDEMFDAVVELKSTTAKKCEGEMCEDTEEKEEEVEASKASIDLDKLAAESKEATPPQPSTEVDHVAKAAAYFGGILTKPTKPSNKK